MRWLETAASALDNISARSTVPKLDRPSAQDKAVKAEVAGARRQPHWRWRVPARWTTLPPSRLRAGRSRGRRDRTGARPPPSRSTVLAWERGLFPGTPSLPGQSDKP
jgi:hypothetical protein